MKLILLLVTIHTTLWCGVYGGADTAENGECAMMCVVSVIFGGHFLFVNSLGDRIDVQSHLCSRLLFSTTRLLLF